MNNYMEHRERALHASTGPAWMEEVHSQHNATLSSEIEEGVHIPTKLRKHDTSEPLPECSLSRCLRNGRDLHYTSVTKKSRCVCSIS